MPNYSMKPGRGPSGMGVVGGVIAVAFGIFWMAGAFSVTSHFPADDTFAHIFPFFGLIFIAAAIAGIVYNLHNARAKNRFSTFDIVESDSEPDPLAPERTAPPAGTAPPAAAAPPQASPGGYCRSCGAPLRAGDHFCGRCGKAVS